MTERTYKDYEELAQLLEDAETAVARVQGKLIDMFPVEAVDEGYRLPAPSRYDEMALHATLKLTKLRYGAPPRVPQRGARVGGAARQTQDTPSSRTGAT